MEIKKSMNTELDDLRSLERANFVPAVKAVAHATITSLHYLKAMAARRNLSMDAITAEMIINELSEKNAEALENRAGLQGTSQIPP